MHVRFQGKMFPAHRVEGTKSLKVMYLNTDRNIAGSVTGPDLDALHRLLGVQSQCCRTTKGADNLEPRP